MSLLPNSNNFSQINTSPSFTYSIIKTLIYLNHHQQNHNWHLWILSSNSTLSPFTIITFFPSRASTKPTLTKTKGKQSFLEVARSFENPPSTGFNAKFAQGKKKKEREIRHEDSYRPNIVLLGIQQGMEGTIDEFISREQFRGFSSFLCPYFCFVRTREGLTMRHAFIRGVYREKAGRLVGKGAEAAGCTRTRKMCVVNCHPRSIRAPSLARAVTRTLRVVVVEAIRRLLFIELEN